MDLEIAIIAAKDDDAAALVKAMDDGGTAHLLACPGCRSVKVLPGIEQPGNVLFLVEWDSIEAHAAAKRSEHFPAFYATIEPYFGGAGSVQHCRAG
jgi:quinol monooxygenase YgiN